MTSSPNQSATSSPFSYNDPEKNDLRLWVGNLDPKITEFQLLKIIQRFGPIENFDFLFHRTGPNAGLPRGYAFVTFKTKEGAQNCLDKLNGKRVLDRTMSVRWAHNATLAYTDEDEKLRKKLPALGMKLETPTAEQSLSKERAISAIEAKLKAMEQEKDVNFNLTSGSKSQNPVSSVSQAVQNYPYASKSSTTYHNYDSHSRIRTKPYLLRKDRNQGRRRF